MSKTLLICGLVLTLLGAVILSWRELRGGGVATIDDNERGFLRTRESRIAFPLIAAGAVLQIIGVATSS